MCTRVVSRRGWENNGRLMCVSSTRVSLCVRWCVIVCACGPHHDVHSNWGSLRVSGCVCVCVCVCLSPLTAHRRHTLDMSYIVCLMCAVSHVTSPSPPARTYLPPPHRRTHLPHTTTCRYTYTDERDGDERVVCDMCVVCCVMICVLMCA